MNLKQPKQCTKRRRSRDATRKNGHGKKQWQYCSDFLILYSTAPVNLYACFMLYRRVYHISLSFFIMNMKCLYSRYDMLSQICLNVFLDACHQAKCERDMKIPFNVHFSVILTTHSHASVNNVWA